MGFLTRLLFGKKDKEKEQQQQHEQQQHEQEEQFEEQEDLFVMSKPSKRSTKELTRETSKIVLNNPMNDNESYFNSNSNSSGSNKDEQKMKKKLSSKYFGKNENEEDKVQENDDNFNSQQLKQNRKMTKQNSVTFVPFQTPNNNNSNNNTNNNKIEHRSGSPQTIATMISPPPFLQSNDEIILSTPNNENKPTNTKQFMSNQVPLVVTNEMFQARGKLRNTPKRPSAMPNPTNIQSTNEIDNPSSPAPPPPQNNNNNVIEKKPFQLNKNINTPPMIQHKVQLKPTNQNHLTTTPNSQQQQQQQQSQSQQPVWGRNMLKQTSQAGRLFGDQPQHLKNVRESPSPTLQNQNNSPSPFDEESLQREQLREATRALRQQTMSQQIKSNQQQVRSSPTIPIMEQDDEHSISTFGSKGRNRAQSGDDGISVVSSISAESSHPITQIPQKMNRKTSTQLKLPITMNRQVGSRVRSDSTEGKKLEKNSTRPNFSTEKFNQNEIKSESPITLQNQLNNEPKEIRKRNNSTEIQQTKEVKEIKEVKEVKPDLKREKSMNRTELKKSKSEVKRELNEILGENKMQLTREKRIMEKIEQEKKEKEEKELEEKRLKFLEEEHRRWKFKDKLDPTNGGKKRTVCGRLFLQVGESNEFDDKDDKIENEEEIKVIQGTLAAELLELIEKSRGIKPVEIKRQDTKEVNNTSNNNNNNTLSSPRAIEKNISKSPNNISSINLENKKQNNNNDSDSDSSFDEEEYFREIAALSFETDGDDNLQTNSQSLGKGPLALVGRIPDSMKVKGSTLSKEAAKTIAKAKKREEKKAKQQSLPIESTEVIDSSKITSDRSDVTNLLSQMVPLKIGMDEEWKRHDSLLARRSSTGRDQYNATGMDRMKELIAEEEKEGENIHHNIKVGFEDQSKSNNRMRSLSCGRGLQNYGNKVIKKGKNIKEMTHRERVWNRAAGSLAGVSFSSSDPILQELKQSAETLGETLLEKEFGHYRNYDEWEGIEIFKKSKKNRMANPQVQNVQFSNTAFRTRSSSTTSTKKPFDDITREQLL